MKAPISKPKFERKNGRSIKIFRHIDPRNEARVNSESVRRLLFDTVWADFGKNLRKCEEAFKKILSQSTKIRGFRTHPTGITEEAFYKVLADKHLNSFSQLDALAQHHKIPMGLMLIFTRARSDLEGAGALSTGEALRLLTACRASIGLLEELLLANPEHPEAYQFLDHTSFIRFRDTYLEEREKWKDSLL